jgi:hypothetical protein
MRSLYSGLVAYWPLHLNSANVANSVLTNADTSVSYVAGPILGAADYAGGANYSSISATIPNLPTGTTPSTTAWWMNIDNIAGEAIPWMWGASSTRQYRCVAMYTDKRCNPAFYSDDLVSPTDVVAYGAWAFWIMTYNGGVLNGTNVKLYKNDANLTLTGGSGASPNTPNAAVYFGRDMVRNVSPIDGKLAEIAIWNRVLDAREMTWLYNSGIGRTYPFDGRPSFRGRSVKLMQAGSLNDR